MSIQPWEVREYDWCSCGARVVNSGDGLCTMCAAQFRLHELELSHDESTETN